MTPEVLVNVADPVKGLSYAVRRLRKEYKISLAELAKRSGVHIRTLKAVEAGRRNSLTLRGALAISKALGGNIKFVISPL